jgi:hypothetical protein
MPVNFITIPQPGTANYAPGPDGTRSPYQPGSTPVPNLAKADGQIGTGSNLQFIPESTPVPNPEGADGMEGTGSNVNFVPSSSNTVITYVPNPNKADGKGTGTGPTPPAPPAPTNLDIDVSEVGVDPSTWKTTLVWQQESDPEFNEVWRSENGGAYHLIATVDGSAVTYTDDTTGMPSFDRWTYKVRAVTDNVGSDFSNEVMAANGINYINDMEVEVISLPNLIVSFLDIEITFASNLTTVHFPKLKACPLENFYFGCPKLVDVDLTSFTRSGQPPVFDDLDFTFDSSLTAINLPNYVECGGRLGFRGCAALSTANFNPNLIFNNGTSSLDFADCALPQETIDFLLRRCVVSGLTTGIIDLSGGTNAPPSAAGLDDANTLIDAGCEVYVNSP